MRCMRGWCYHGKDIGDSLWCPRSREIRRGCQCHAESSVVRQLGCVVHVPSVIVYRPQHLHRIDSGGNEHGTAKRRIYSTCLLSRRRLGRSIGELSARQGCGRVRFRSEAQRERRYGMNKAHRHPKLLDWPFLSLQGCGLSAQTT